MKKNYFFYCLSLLFLALASVSCSKSELDDINLNKEPHGEIMGEYTYKLHFNCKVDGEVETRTSYDWNKNDEVFILFSSSVEGKATYDGTDWVITSSKAIPVKTSATDCVATYIENGSQNAQKLPYSGSGTYTHASSEDDVYVNVIVEPQTWRLRFSGSNGTTIKLAADENDIKYYSSCTADEIVFAKSNVSLTVSNGYTPYIYGILAKSGDNTITIENNGKKYSRTVNSKDLDVKKSAVLTIPTESNYEDKGWTKVEDTPPVNTLYREPCLEWGASVSRVKSFMSGYTVKSEDTAGGTLTYNGKDKEELIQYSFKNGGLQIAAVGLSGANVTMAEIKAQLNKSYLLLSDESDDEPMWVSEDFATAIMVQSQNGVFLVLYVDLRSIGDDLFEAPYTVWGAARSTVKSEMSKRGYSILDDTNTAAAHYRLVYDGKKEEMMSFYYFDDSQKLDEVDVYLYGNTTSLQKVGDFMKSGLSYQGGDKITLGGQDMYLYISPDQKTCALLFIDSEEDICVWFSDINNFMVKGETRSANNSQFVSTGKSHIHASKELKNAVRKSSAKQIKAKLNSLDLKFFM